MHPCVFVCVVLCVSVRDLECARVHARVYVYFRVCECGHVCFAVFLGGRTKGGCVELKITVNSEENGSKVVS